MTALTTPTERPTRSPARSAEAECAALWAMTREERVAAMWRSELTLRQLGKWSSRVPHEVPLLGGEFAWIVMRTPEWAETKHNDRAGCAPENQEAKR